MKRTVEDMRRDLAEERRCLRDLQERGDAACSDYDLMMGYDAAFNIGLAEAHIAHHEREIAEATKDGEQLTLGL